MLGCQRTNDYFLRALMVPALPFIPMTVWEILGILINLLPFTLCGGEEGPSLIIQPLQNPRILESTLPFCKPHSVSLEVVGKCRDSSCPRARDLLPTSSQQGSQGATLPRPLAANNCVGVRISPRFRVGPVSKETHLSKSVGL